MADEIVRALPAPMQVSTYSAQAPDGLPAGSDDDCSRVRPNGRDDCDLAQLSTGSEHCNALRNPHLASTVLFPRSCGPEGQGRRVRRASESCSSSGVALGDPALGCAGCGASRESPRRMRRGRLLVPLCVHTAVLVVCAFCAYWTMFSSYKFYDDEGYHLWSLRLFATGHALYNDVFSSYGPFPYELWAGISKLTGADRFNEQRPMVTIALWLGTSVLLAVSTRRLTGSLTLAVVVQVLSFSVLTPFADEPMSPGGTGLIVVCGLLAVAVFTLRAHPRRALSRDRCARGCRAPDQDQCRRLHHARRRLHGGHDPAVREVVQDRPRGGDRRSGVHRSCRHDSDVRYGLDPTVCISRCRVDRRRGAGDRSSRQHDRAGRRDQTLDRLDARWLLCWLRSHPRRHLCARHDSEGAVRRRRRGRVASGRGVHLSVAPARVHDRLGVRRSGHGLGRASDPHRDTRPTAMARGVSGGGWPGPLVRRRRSAPRRTRGPAARMGVAACMGRRGTDVA